MSAPPRSRITLVAIKLRRRMARDLWWVLKLLGGFLVAIAMFATLQAAVCRWETPTRKMAACVLPQLRGPR